MNKRCYYFMTGSRSATIAIFLCAAVVTPIASSEKLLQGAILTPLTTDSKSQAWSWAYRGNRIAYLLLASDSQAQLRIMNADGTGDRAVSPIGNPFFVEWSWAGDKLSYEFSNYRKKDSPAEVSVYDVATNRSMVLSRTYSFGALSSTQISSSELPGMTGPLSDGPFWSPDDKYVAYTIQTLGGSKEVWVADANSGRFYRPLSTRRFVGGQRWSYDLPHRLVVLVDASGGNDVATIDVASSKLTLLTTIGSKRVRNEFPRWSPAGDWIAYLSDEEMRDEEQDKGRNDVWIARPDGSERRNLTQASSNSVQDQLQFLDIEWSWDGQWIRAFGNRFDLQGRGISSVFLVNPEGGYEIVQTSDPERTGQLERAFAGTWAYDSTKLALLSIRNRIRDWTSDPEFENTRTVLQIYNLETKTLHDVLEFTEETDYRELLGRVSWSPDGRSMLLTIDHIISVDERITHPNIYRLDLHRSIMAPELHLLDGPPVGVGSSLSRTVLDRGTTPTRAPDESAVPNPPSPY